MKITRIDLDGAGSPHALVARILKLEPDLTYPIPIEALAQQLDIIQIKELQTEGFEGGLLTDVNRAEGIILVNKEARGGRHRFTIGHELGHFLIVTHAPVDGKQFLCSRSAMLRWTDSQTDRYARMEFEANQFAALMLMPPPLLRRYIANLGEPNLEHIKKISEDFEVSKDSAARSYAMTHHAPVAIVIVKQGKILRHYRHANFPPITLAKSANVPKGTVFHRPSLVRGEPSDVVQTLPNNWVNVNYGHRAPELFEQVLLQANDFAMIMLQIEKPDNEDDDEDLDESRTAKERLQNRISARWR